MEIIGDMAAALSQRTLPPARRHALARGTGKSRPPNLTVLRRSLERLALFGVGQSGYARFCAPARLRDGNGVTCRKGVCQCLIEQILAMTFVHSTSGFCDNA